MKKKNYLIIGAVAVISVAALGGATASYALQSNAAGKEMPKEKTADWDYSAFKEKVDAGCQMGEKITEENFDRFKEMHVLRKEGNHEEAEKIREELGLPEMEKFGHGKKDGKKERNPEFEEALENGDFEAFKEAVGDKPFFDQITEENFSKFVEMHNLKEEGKYEEAKALASELGLEKPEKGFGKKGGMHKKGDNHKPRF